MFQANYVRYTLKGSKLYRPVLTRAGWGRYSHRYFRRATEAKMYAGRWAKKANSIIGGLKWA
jgi:hypothetical protein